jgi:5-methylcytosine-specific restriction endonuclease McrA
MALPQKKLTYKQRRSKALNYTKKPEVRRRIFLRDNYRCVKCGSTEDLTVDHITSVYQGGTDEDSNLQTLCNTCNSRKAP